jgi:hypothetical protein
MKRSRAVDVLGRLDPEGDPGVDDAARSPEARALLGSILDSEPVRELLPRPRRIAPRLVTAAVVILLALPAGYGLWRAFGPALTNHENPGPSQLAASPNATASGPITPQPPADQRYEATGLVLERTKGPAAQPPMLCLGGVLESLPPQCGTLPITNWDWDRVEGEQRMNGVTWGDFHVVGTYDGESFTVLQVGPPQPEPSDPADAIEIPCPEPDGGWVATDPGRAGDADEQAALHYTDAQPDSAGTWVKHTEPNPSDLNHGPNDVVLNAAFTGDIERHRRELSQLWGGPLCVVQYERTQAELHHIQKELTERGSDEFGFTVLFASTDIVRNRVEIGVVVADDATRAAVDARYGEGVVLLVPALHPVG